MAIIRWTPGTIPSEWCGQARWWYDGDTLMVDGGPVRSCVRLWGIDAPEWGQAGAGAARDALRMMTRSTPVVISPVSIDQYGRIVARLGTHAVEDIGLALLRRGLVWWYWHFAPDCQEYKAAFAAARIEKLGLWASRPYAWAPWLWRRGGRSRSV